MKVAVYSAIRRCLRSATMVLPPRARPSYWPRSFPRTLVKTCALALGVLLWLLYFYSSSYAYDRRPPGGGDSKRADGFILRRPTVPLFEGPVEGDGADDPPPSSGPKVTAAPRSEVRRGNYSVLEKLLESRLRFGYNQSVTITTHATYELLDNLIYLSQRWQGPISVAVYAPHEDFKTALLYALWLRRCHSTVRDFVTFHFVYPAPQRAVPSGGSGQHSPSTSSPEPPKASQRSRETFQKTLPESIQVLPDAVEALRNPPLRSSESLRAIRSTSDAAFRNSTEASATVEQKTTKNSSGTSKGEPKSFLNSPGKSKAIQNSAGKPEVLLNSHGKSTAIQNSPRISNASSGSPDTVQYSPDGSSMAFQNLAESSKMPQHLPDAPNSPEELSKTLRYSVGAFQKSAEPFQEPFLGYEQLARDIVGRYGEGSTAPAVPSCESTSFSLPRSYRHRHGLPYPINVCRNVARLNAETHFVLASDIELYPSADVIPAFLEFSRLTGLVQQPGWEATERSPASSLASFFLRGPAVVAATHPLRRVFVLPIFEVDRSVGAVPATKAALVDLYRRKKAVYFHKHVCSFCNIIPRLNRWLVAPVPRGHQLGIFMSIKRHKPFNRWEPIYIGTNNEPLYDERLSWEGQQDKMTQMYELCLMNYDLAIMDNAFLVHRPGIKTKNATEYKLKSQFIAQNNKIYKTIITDLEKKHGTNSWCK